MITEAEKVSPPVVLRANKLAKRYTLTSRSERRELQLFNDLDFELCAGELVAIVGESGVGKSSLLHLLAALDRPTTGDVWYGDQRLSGMSERQAAVFRNREIGYVWQFHYLLPEFTALENVALPLMAGGLRRRPALDRAEHWLGAVGLSDRADHRSGELSGGEQQRVSLARALVTEPKILLADEPTGDLDEGTSEAVFDLLQRLHVATGLASVLVTHNTGFAQRCDRMLMLRKGRLHSSTSDSICSEFPAHSPSSRS